MLSKALHGLAGTRPLGLLGPFDQGMSECGSVDSRRREWQIRVSDGGRRVQIFVPESKFGGGWKGFALVLEHFAFGDGRAS